MSITSVDMVSFTIEYNKKLQGASAWQRPEFKKSTLFGNHDGMI